MQKNEHFIALPSRRNITNQSSITESESGDFAVSICKSSTIVHANHSFSFSASQ